MNGQTYAIPTIGKGLKHRLSIEEIKPYVDDFIEFATLTPSRTFLVTAIGTGIAGLTAEDIAPLFKAAIKVHNIHLPESFWNVLEAIGV
jgi:hypothetical protein